MKELKPCPFRVHGELVASLTVHGEFYYNETFMPCMGETCACYSDRGYDVVCFREHMCFTLWDGNDKGGK